MVTRFMSIALVLMLAFAAVACGGGDDDNAADSGPVSMSDAETCEQLADAFMPLMQEVLDSLSELSMADLMAMEEDPEVLDQFEDRLDEVSEKSSELNCDSDEMAALLGARMDQLTATGPVAELVLELIREDFQ